MATYQIYPLSAGTTQIRFSEVNLTRANFVQNADGSRDVEGTEDLPVVPAMIELTITGETVPPPEEATPTPEPTEAVNLPGSGANVTAEATLEIVILQPTLIPELEVDEPSNMPLILAVGMLVVGVVGLLGLFVMRKR